MASSTGGTDALVPFLPRVVHEWLVDEPDRRWRAVDATVVFVDISGFTRLSEKLAAHGRRGAEELTDVISSSFSHLLEVACAQGGTLLKFGGDALLIMFTGDDHTERACAAALAMRARLRDVALIDAPGGRVRLRMSVGVHRGEFLLFLVGDSHRELVITGPAASMTVQMEGTAEAGDIVVSAATAAHLPRWALGPAKGEGRLLRGRPADPSSAAPMPSVPRAVDSALAIPEALRAPLLAGADEAEHRVATIAFVHFDGADELARAEGPEALAVALDELVSSTAGLATQHGVTFLATDIDRDGGKIILAAGVPLASDHDEERMLRVARGIVDAGHRLPVRVGVNRGHVFSGCVGPTFRRTYTVMGDTVNLAARVMAKAEPGQVLATGGVVDSGGAPFPASPLPPFLVKGKTRPVQAYSIGRARRASLALALAHFPFTGRDVELRELGRLIDRARDGNGTVVEVRGEQGVGKSRLVHEIIERAADFDEIRIACLPYQSANAYWTVRELLALLLGVRTDDDVDMLESKLRDAVATRAPDLAPWTPLLGGPLQLDIADTPDTAALEGRFRKQRVDEVTTTFLGALLPERAIVVLEDAHWMDEASADVLRVVEDVITATPFVVFVTRNDDDGGYHADGVVSHVMRLTDLPARDATQLVNRATEERPLPPHEVDLVVRRADGNARFLVELVRETMTLGATDVLPDSVDSLVSAQLDRLPVDARRIVRYASVLGHAFDVSLLEALVPSIELGEPDPSIKEFLVFDGPDRLRFRHALQRDVAYAGLLYRVRSELHRRAGDVIEQSATRPDDHAAVLSLHFLQGERFDAAWRYARLGADRAGEDYANVEAAELYERAVAAARRLPALAPAELATVNEALGDVRERMGVFDRAREAYRAARRLLADDAVRGARLCLKEAWIAERLGRYSLAVRWIRRGFALLDAAEVDGAPPDRAATSARAQLAVWFGVVRETVGRHREAVEWCETALELARRGGDLDAEAHALFVLDWVHGNLGQLESAANSERALELYVELGDLSGQAVVANNLGIFAYYQGRWNDALALYEQSRDARLRTGNAVDAALAATNIAEILIEQCKYEDAEALLEDARRVYRAAGYRPGVATCLARLGRVAARTGRTDDAYRMFEEAKELFLSVEGTFEAIEVDSMLGEALVVAGEAAIALAIAETAITRAQAGGEIGVLGTALFRTRAYALAQLGRYEDAVASLQHSLALAREQQVDYEVALDLIAWERIDEWAGIPHDDDGEAVLILRRLDVATVPAPVFGSATR